MTPAILDGRARFGCSLVEFYQRHDIVQQAARSGLLIPPATPEHTDASAAPALAFVNPLDVEPVSRWIARCPDCAGGAAYVWLEGPHLMWCLSCGNRTIGGAWRPIQLPATRLEIERLLLARPDPSQRAWLPGESLKRLRAENARLGV